MAMQSANESVLVRMSGRRIRTCGRCENMTVPLSGGMVAPSRQRILPADDPGKKPEGCAAGPSACGEAFIEGASHEGRRSMGASRASILQRFLWVFRFVGGVSG